MHHLLECLPQRVRILGLFRLLRLGQRLLEIQHIERPGSIWGRLPLQAVFISVEEMAGIRECLPQLIQQFTQVGVCLSLSRIRPQEKGQARATLGRAPVEHEVGK